MIVMTPGQDVDAGYVPGEVYDEPAARNVFGEHPGQIRRRDLLPVIFNAFLCPFAQPFPFILEIYHRNILVRHFDMLKENR